MLNTTAAKLIVLYCRHKRQCSKIIMDWFAQGKQFGLEGAELINYVGEQQALEREERKQERQDRKDREMRIERRLG